MRSFRSFFAGVLVVALALLAGCLTIPLGDPEKSKVDDAYLGFWVNSRPSDDEGKLLVVQAYDGKTYLVTQYNFRQTANGVESIAAKMTQKAWLTPVGKATFVTFARMDAGNILNKDDKPYSIARVSHEGSTLTARPVDPNFVAEHKVTSSDQLEKLVTENLENNKMYAEAQVYEKIPPQRYNEVKDILAAFGENYE